jgi:hypothetical protein
LKRARRLLYLGVSLLLNGLAIPLLLVAAAAAGLGAGIIEMADLVEEEARR